MDYIDGYVLRYGLGFGFQTQWLHCAVQNISHCPDSDAHPYSLFLCGTGIRIRAIILGGSFHTAT